MTELTDTAIRQVVKPKEASDFAKRQAAAGAAAVEHDRIPYADYARQRAIDEGFRMDGPYKDPLS